MKNCCSASAEVQTVLAVLDAQYQFDPAVALLGGAQQFDENSELALGLEFSFNCLLLDSLRTQIGVTGMGKVPKCIAD